MFSFALVLLNEQKVYIDTNCKILIVEQLYKRNLKFCFDNWDACGSVLLKINEFFLLRSSVLLPLQEVRHDYWFMWPSTLYHTIHNASHLLQCRVYTYDLTSGKHVARFSSQLAKVKFCIFGTIKKNSPSPFKVGGKGVLPRLTPPRH